MTAIETYFIGPTNFRGSRYKAIALGTKQSLTIGADDSLDYPDNHQRAAMALARKHGWIAGPNNRYGDWYMGDGGPRGYVFVMACDYSKVEKVNA